MRTISTTSTLAPMATITSFPTTRSATHSPWHSPIPYLFGGLAAMLGLIAFALLMLACSYWRLSNQSQSQGGDNIRDLEKEGEDPQKKEPFKAYEEKVLVIMAGEEKPTFLATPVFPIHGKHHGKDCDTQLGNRENTFDVSEKETMDKDINHVVHANVITITQENEGSQGEQQNQ